MVSVSRSTLLPFAVPGRLGLGLGLGLIIGVGLGVPFRYLSTPMV